VVAISPILLYIGMRSVPRRSRQRRREHAPAIALALTPHAAAWAATLIGGALGAAGMQYGATHAPEFVGKMAQNGVLSRPRSDGRRVRSWSDWCSAPLRSSSSTASSSNASAFALAGAVMTYFGFMHGEAIGIGGGFGVNALRSVWPI